MGTGKQGGIFSLFLFITEKPGTLCPPEYVPEGETPVSSQTHRQSSLLTMPSVPQGPGVFSIHYSAVTTLKGGTQTQAHDTHTELSYC